MTGHLRVVPGPSAGSPPPGGPPARSPLDYPPPGLNEYRGQRVSWEPWRPGYPGNSLAFHTDTRCTACGHDDRAAGPQAIGLVHRDGATVPNRQLHHDQRGRVAATTTNGRIPAPPTRELGAGRCTGCGMVTVVHLLDPDWWWTSAPDGELDLALEGRLPDEDPAPRRRPPAPPSAPVPDVEALALLPAPATDPAARARAEVAAKLGWSPSAGADALRVRCSACGSGPRLPCTRPRRGARVECAPHPSRVELAAATPTQ